MKYLNFIFLISLLVGCVKESPKDSLDGRYTGFAHMVDESNSYHYGHQIHDTVWWDTIVVKLINKDSISFMHDNFEKKFVLSNDGIYDYVRNSFKGGFEYKLKNDSLIYRTWSYGGTGENYNSSKFTFKGKKED